MIRVALAKKDVPGLILLVFSVAITGCTQKASSTTQIKSGTQLTTPSTSHTIDGTTEDTSSITDNLLAQALSSPTLIGWKSIYSLSSNTACLAVNGSNIISRDCTSNTASNLAGFWFFDPSTFEIKLKTSSGFKCLSGSSSDTGSAPTLTSCNGSSLQKWTYTSDYLIQNLSSSLCLVLGSDSITQDTCNTDTNAQKWGIDYQTASVQWSYLKNSQFAAQCFAVNDSGATPWSDGASVISQNCNSIPASNLNHLWSINRLGLNTVSITTQTQNGKGLQCLDISPTNTNQVVIQPCTNLEKQVWILDANQLLKNKSTQQCLGVSSSSPTQLVTQACNTSASNQKWSFVGLNSPPSWTLLQSPSSTTTCAVVQNGKGAGSALTSQTCDLTGKVILSKRFLWFFDPNTSEIKTDTETGDGIQCLDIQGQTTAANGLAVINSCSGGTSQKWEYTSDNQLKNENSGLCLSTDGTNLRQYYCSGSSNWFKWNFTSMTQNDNWWSLKKTTDSTQCYVPVKLTSTNYNINAVSCTQTSGANSWIGGSGLWSYDIATKQLKTTALDSNGTQCLAFQGTSRDVGAKVSALSCTGSADQQWEFTPDRQIRSASTGLCLYHSQGYFIQDYCTKTSGLGQWILTQ